MYLFKSDWLHHSRQAFRAPAAPVFARRYGPGAEMPHAPPVTPPVRTPELSAVEHERAVMRYLAQADRAA